MLLLSPLQTRFRSARAVLAVLAAFAAGPALGQGAADAEAPSVFSMFFTTDQWFGLAIIWLLFGLSAGSLGYAIKLVLQFRRDRLLPETTFTEIQSLIAGRNYREAIELADRDDSFLGRVVGSALHESVRGYAAMERAILETGDAETARILRPVEYLNVVGNIAPMIGLFGTVYGMIVAFQTLVAAGGSPDPAELAGGISTALVTTFWGLIVAIPALAAYALIRNKIDALTSEGIVMCEQLIRPFKPSALAGRRGPRGAAPAGRPADEPHD